MKKSEYIVLGIMSGTSLDGVDMALTKFVFSNQWKYEILIAETIPYPKYWINKLSHLTLLNQKDLNILDQSYTGYLAEVANDFIQKYSIQHIDFISSHGHTAKHQPSQKITFQIGNLKHLASLTQQLVVCDFRKQDVALNGQGAPLVPIGDRLLFSDYDFCLNLGGFANISFERNKKRVAYDICPVNIVLNHYVSNIGKDFDDRGFIASTGSVNLDLLNKLNGLEFYQEDYPKSLGLEWVKSNVFNLIDAYDLELQDVLRTFVHHIAYQISKEINKKTNANILITGGGVHNEFLIEEIRKRTNNVIVIPDNLVIDFKEALIFGFLGILRIRGENNCLSSVTGAIKDHCSGIIHCP